MLHLEAECPSKQNILIAGTSLSEPGPYPGFNVWGGEYSFIFVFIICLKQIFPSTTKFGVAQKRFWGQLRLNAPSVCRPGKNRHLKVFDWGTPHVCAGGLDILKFYI